MNYSISYEYYSLCRQKYSLCKIYFGCLILKTEREKKLQQEKCCRNCSHNNYEQILVREQFVSINSLTIISNLFNTKKKREKRTNEKLKEETIKCTAERETIHTE